LPGRRISEPGFQSGHQVTSESMIRTLDLFCGGGGSSWGAARAGARVVGAVDAWNIATDTFSDNFPDAQVCNVRLHRRSNRRLFGDIGEIDLLLASPECTNHTCARGSLDWDESSRETALYVLNYARAFKPRWLIIENVIQMRNWDRYGDLLDALRAEYRIRPQVLDAADFGVPQSRRRLFILCDRKREPPDLSSYRVDSPLAARHILDRPGTWSTKPLRNPRRAAETLARANRAIAHLGEGEPFLIVYYSTDGGGGWQTLDRPIRTLTTLDRFGLVEWNGSEPSLRMLQVPELQRAMGFDSAYKLQRGSRRDRIKLLGNGVCPPVIRQVVTALTGLTASTRAKVVTRDPTTLQILVSETALA
jgi:DNA (cytosine-5)-methyltransferase 1